MRWKCFECGKDNNENNTACGHCAALPPVRAGGEGGGGMNNSVLDDVDPQTSIQIETAARAWVDAGGDADGVDCWWGYISARVRELEGEVKQCK